MLRELVIVLALLAGTSWAEPGSVFTPSWLANPWVSYEVYYSADGIYVRGWYRALDIPGAQVYLKFPPDASDPIWMSHDLRPSSRRRRWFTSVTTLPGGILGPVEKSDPLYDQGQSEVRIKVSGPACKRKGCTRTLATDYECESGYCDPEERGDLGECGR